jgi:hypothetical protein
MTTTTPLTFGAVASLPGSTEETLTARQSREIFEKETRILIDLREREAAAVAALGKVAPDDTIAFERARNTVYDHLTAVEKQKANVARVEMIYRSAAAAGLQFVARQQQQTNMQPPISAAARNPTLTSVSNTTGTISHSRPPAERTGLRLESVSRTLYLSPTPVLTDQAVHPTIPPQPGSNIAEYGAPDTRYWRHSFNLNRRRRERLIEIADDPLDLSQAAPETQLAIPDDMLAPLDPATRKEVLDSAEELFHSDATFLDLYLKKQLMLQDGYVAKSVRELKTDFTPSDSIKDTPEMKVLAIQYQQLGIQYKSDVTKLFTASVEFQKTKHIELIPALVVQSIFRICLQHIKRFTTQNVLLKKGYADFDDSDDDTAARAKLADEGTCRARERNLAGFATLFLITDLYGILREYCYPNSKLRNTLPMNSLFRLAVEYTTRHASIDMFPLDLNDMDQDLDSPGIAQPAPLTAQPLTQAAALPDRPSETPPAAVPPQADESSDVDGLFDESTIDSTANSGKPTATGTPLALPPKVSEAPTAPPPRLSGEFVTALSLLEATPADRQAPSSPVIKQTNGIPEYIYTSEEEVQVPDGCPFMIGDGMFMPPANMTDYRIARRTATEMKEIISFITAYRRLGLSRATGATLMIASLNDGRIKHRTNKSTLNVAYLLQSIDSKDEKERRGVLKKCISEIRNFFEKVYRRHKQTTIRFAAGVADSPAPKTSTPSPAPPSVLRRSNSVAAPSPPQPVATPPSRTTATNTGPNSPNNRKRGGPAQSGAGNHSTNNHNNARTKNKNKKARTNSPGGGPSKNSQGGGPSLAPAAPSPLPKPHEQPQQPTPPSLAATTTKKNKNRRRGKGKKNA